MAHMRVTDPAGYVHYWTPAGAHTAYPPGFQGTVKRAVLEAAIKAGKGEDMDAVVVVEAKPKRIRVRDEPQIPAELDVSDGA